DRTGLRRAVGYEPWNLYGASCGTRLALTATRDCPEGIRAVVLDAAYPLEANLYAETPRNVDRAFDAFFAACEADAGCASAFPDLEETFVALVDRLNQSPAPIQVVAGTGMRYESEMSGDALVGFLFQGLYATDLIQFLPEIIDRK